MKKQYVIVEHRSNRALDNLRNQSREIQSKYDKLLKDYHRLEMMYGEEVMLNGELVDILKMNQIPFRSSLSHNFRT